MFSLVALLNQNDFFKDPPPILNQITSFVIFQLDSLKLSTRITVALLEVLEKLVENLELGQKIHSKIFNVLLKQPSKFDEVVWSIFGKFLQINFSEKDRLIDHFCNECSAGKVSTGLLKFAENLIQTSGEEQFSKSLRLLHSTVRLALNYTLTTPSQLSLSVLAFFVDNFPEKLDLFEISNSLVSSIEKFTDQESGQCQSMCCAILISVGYSCKHRLDWASSPLVSSVVPRELAESFNAMKKWTLSLPPRESK